MYIIIFNEGIGIIEFIPEHRKIANKKIIVTFFILYVTNHYEFLSKNEAILP